MIFRKPGGAVNGPPRNRPRPHRSLPPWPRRPNLVRATLQCTSQEYPGYDALTQGTGFLNARGAVQLAEYFYNKQVGSPYPSMHGWSKQIFWGNKRVRGGVLTPGGTAWGGSIEWGSKPEGMNIVWGESTDPDASWGSSGTDAAPYGDESAEILAFDPLAWDAENNPELVIPGGSL